MVGEGVGAPAGLDRARQQRVARRGAHALGESVPEAQHHHLPGRGRDGEQGAGERRGAVAEGDERLAPPGPVAGATSPALDHGHHRLGRRLHGAERCRPAAQRGQEARQQRVDHLARHVLEERRCAEPAHYRRQVAPGPERATGGRPARAHRGAGARGRQATSGRESSSPLG
jgi:hypothetical protein